MKNLTVLFIFIILLLFAAETFSDSLIVVDKIDRIDQCTAMASELGLTHDRHKKDFKVNPLEFKTLNQKLMEAQDRFYKLDISMSEKILDDTISILENSIVFGGSMGEIYSSFVQLLSYKTLILLSRKEDLKTKEFINEFSSIFIQLSLDNKKIHPSLRNLLSANIEALKGNTLRDNKTEIGLKKLFENNKNVLFNGYSSIPDTIYRGKHILILEIGNQEYRVVIKNFLEELDNPIYVTYYKNWDVYIVLSEEAFINAKNRNMGNEIFFCRADSLGLITADGRTLSKEEIIAKGLKIEIMKTDGEMGEVSKKSNWWLIAIGGMLVTGIVTTLILIGTGDEETEIFRDKIEVK
ncbi:MAG: hypothetical protein N2746_05665 [Deltaproteobacteria bacterium]|nr:hypothetical protein [Deltaproteobacteria bacterium]